MKTAEVSTGPFYFEQDGRKKMAYVGASSPIYDRNGNLAGTGGKASVYVLADKKEMTSIGFCCVIRAGTGQGNISS